MKTSSVDSQGGSHVRRRFRWASNVSVRFNFTAATGTDKASGSSGRSVIWSDERGLAYEELRDLHQRYEARNEIKGGESNGPVNGAMEQAYMDNEINC